MDRPEKYAVETKEKPYNDPWKHRSTLMKCETCMWFVEKKPKPIDGPYLSYSNRDSVGRCRRHAPAIQGYPVVFKHDWCGDHKVDENKVQ